MTKFEMVQISDLRHGDTVEVNGNQMTVHNNHIKSDFYGTRFQGERLKLVKRILFPKWYQGEIRGFAAQI